MALITQDLDGTEKLRELILYISCKSETDEKFGATKLNKLLFDSDFSFYVAHGRSITGAEYQKLDHGPAPRLLMPLQDQMSESRELHIVERDHYGSKQLKPLALRCANLNLFSAEEISFVDELIRRFWNLSVTDVSQLSRDFSGWQLARLGETIPYESTLIDNSPLTHDELDWVDSLDLSELKSMVAC